MAKFYRDVLGLSFAQTEPEKITAAHFIGWGKTHRDRYVPSRQDDPVDAFVCRVAIPYGPVIVVSCCQIKKKLSPLEALSLAGDGEDLCVLSNDAGATGHSVSGDVAAIFGSFSSLGASLIARTGRALLVRIAEQRRRHLAWIRKETYLLFNRSIP